MTRPVDDTRRILRCVQCGKVDAPIRVGPGPGWLALMLWAGSALLWTLGMVLGSTGIGYLAAAVFLAALIYTLWYFYRREQACRHCGGRRLEPEATTTGP